MSSSDILMEEISKQENLTTYPEIKGTHNMSKIKPSGISIKTDNEFNEVFTNSELLDCKPSTSGDTNVRLVDEDLNLEENSKLEPEDKKIVKLFVKDEGPHWYNVQNNIVSDAILTKNLPQVYEHFPIFDIPECRANLQNFYERKIKEFVGNDLDDAEFNELKNYCSIDHLKTGDELVMPTNIPQTGTKKFSDILNKETEEGDQTKKASNLFVIRNLKIRLHRDKKNLFTKRLKYRGVRIIPLSMHEEEQGPEMALEPPDLEPGKDLLFNVRVYRPFEAQNPYEGNTRSRQSVFSCNMVICGRQPLTALRDRIVCRSDFDVRIDVSENPDAPAGNAVAKDLFPSGFMFINNVFYVDERPGCSDLTEVIRTWAQKRGKGIFKRKSMDIKLQDIPLRLAHPEVYVHQGNCEHLFIFSEIRLLNYSDPLHLSCYPCHTIISQNHMIYCTTCAEFAAKWIVTGCERVPFDPAFFCDVCLKQYLYKDGVKICEFKAHHYRGNEINIFKTGTGQ